MLAACPIVANLNALFGVFCATLSVSHAAPKLFDIIMSAPLLAPAQSQSATPTVLLAVGSTLIAAGVALLTFGQAPSTSSLWVTPAGVRVASTQPSVARRTVMPSSTAARQPNIVTMRAAFGGDDKKKITREDEPEDYWISEVCRRSLFMQSRPNCCVHSYAIVRRNRKSLGADWKSPA